MGPSLPHRTVLGVFLPGDRYRFRDRTAYPFTIHDSEGNGVTPERRIYMPGILPGAVFSIAKIPTPRHKGSIAIGTAISKNSDCPPCVITEINRR